MVLYLGASAMSHIGDLYQYAWLGVPSLLQESSGIYLILCGGGGVRVRFEPCCLPVSTDWLRKLPGVPVCCIDKRPAEVVTLGGTGICVSGSVMLPVFCSEHQTS